MRKILFAMQVKKQAPSTNEYRINPQGEIRVFGGRCVYKGMKRAHRERGGFVAPKPRVVTAGGQADLKRNAVRERKRFARQRRRKREAEERADAQTASHHRPQ